MLCIRCHVSIEGGYAEMAKRALFAGADTFQFFAKNPRGRGQGKLPDESEMDEFFRDNIGVCLDTCHVHDGGYRIASDPAGVIEEFDRVIGIERLRAISTGTPRR